MGVCESEVEGGSDQILGAGRAPTTIALAVDTGVILRGEVEGGG